MNAKRRPTIDENKLGINPFIVNEFIKARNFSKNIPLISQDDGINIPVGNYKQSNLVEDQDFTKVFHDKDYRAIIMNLSEKALKLYNFIIFTIRTGEDYIWINNTIFQNECSYRKKDYILAVEELKRYGIITSTSYSETYFINPFIFFCGDRLKKYPNNIKIR